VVLVVSILLVSFYFQAISENQLSKRYADSVRALWLAESGIAKMKSQQGLFAVSDNIDSTNYTYNVSDATRIGLSDYYTAVSTGTVAPAFGASVSRVISVTFKLIPPNASKFQYGVESTTSSEHLIYKEKNITNTENPANIAKANSTQTFEDLFGVTTATMKAGAGTYLQSRNLGNTLTVSGITWVDVTDANGLLNPSGLLQIEHLNGSGTLVICGDFKITGLGTFDGILYCIGALTMRGNPTINGTVFVESGVDMEYVDLSGSSLVNYDSAKIGAALQPLSYKQIVSWKEN